jgi:predicted Zn-dependent protease
MEVSDMKKYLKLNSFVFLVLFTLVVILIQCAVNPVTGKKEIMLISESMEIDMGKDIDRALRLEYGLYNDPQLRSYVKQIGSDLVPFTHRPHLQYHFEILDTPVENAFAAPGGYIYITRGLLAMLNSEAELATVLGHELGHVNARHSARQMTRSILVTLGIAIAGELSEDIRKIAPVSYIAAQLLFLKYSRSDEYQADALGIEYATKAGYSAGEMVNFFSSLQRLTESEGGARIPNFLSTHPLTPRRIERVKELLASEEYQHTDGTSPLIVKREPYINKLDGLVYGINPRQGFLEGNTFYHPDMQFYFRIPNGWDVANTARQVTLGPKDGKAVIILQAEDTTEDLESYSQKMMKNVNSPKVLQKEYRYSNGMNTYHTLLGIAASSENDSEEEKKGEAVNMRIDCIRKGGTIFTFFSAAALSDYSRYRYYFDSTTASFNHLRSAGYLNRKPVRVLIKKADRSQSLRYFLVNMNIPGEYWDRISILNAVELDQRLIPDQLIKIVR